VQIKRQLSKTAANGELRNPANRRLKAVILAALGMLASTAAPSLLAEQRPISDFLENRVFSFLLVVVLLWQFSDWIKSDLFPDADLALAAPPLDSFSPPSLALGVLNREALRLELVYSQGRQQIEQLSPGQSVASGRCPDERPVDSALSTQAAASIGSIETLQRQIETVSYQLDCRLLWIYSENHLDRDFLDRYLQVLDQAPGGADAKLWLPAAVASAHRCGRAQELRDAFEHVIRFHRDSQGVETLAHALERRGMIRPAAQDRATR
jgi:hypothetical protein